MAVYTDRYIDKALTYIHQDIALQGDSDTFLVGDDTLLKVNRAMMISGLFKITDYHKLLRSIESAHKDRHVNYVIAANGKFLNLNFLELRKK